MMLYDWFFETHSQQPGAVQQALRFTQQLRCITTASTLHTLHTLHIPQHTPNNTPLTAHRSPWVPDLCQRLLRAL